MSRRFLLADWQGVLKDGWRSPQVLLLVFAASIPHRLRAVVRADQQLRGRCRELHRPGARDSRIRARDPRFSRLHRGLHASHLAPADLRHPRPHHPGPGGGAHRSASHGLGPLFHHDPDVHGLSLPRDHGTVALDAVDIEGGTPARPGPHGGRGGRRVPRRLRTRLRRLRVPGSILLDRLPHRRNGHPGTSACSAGCSSRVSANRASRP